MDPTGTGSSAIADSQATPVPLERALELLKCGRMELLGLLPYASNATLLSRIDHDGLESLAVYKPRRGEAPLWDFPTGSLCLREAAAWEVDRELGWNLVPPTVLREGPAGFGAVQLYIEEDEQVDIRRLPQTHPDELRRLACFDLVVNNADRKAGHCIVDMWGKLWGVDHGIAFHEEPKLRTVIWVYAGEPLPPKVLRDVSRLRDALYGDELTDRLRPLLDDDEIDALVDRCEELVETGAFPLPGPGRNVPWPPW